MTSSKAAMVITMVACVQAAAVLGLCRFGFAGSFTLVSVYSTSLVACWAVLRRTPQYRRSPGSHIVALVAMGAIQTFAVVVA